MTNRTAGHDRVVAGGAPDRVLTPTFLTAATSAFVYFLAFGMVIPVLPKLVVDDLGGGELAVGVVVGATAVSAITVRPFLGRLGDSWGRRMLIVVGLSIAAVAFAGHSVAPAVAGLVGLRLLGGAAHAMIFVGTTTLVTDLAAPARRGEAVSYFSTAPYLGLGFGPVLGETLGHTLGYRPTFLVAASLGAAAVLPALLLPRRRAAMETDGGAAAGEDGRAAMGRDGRAAMSQDGRAAMGWNGRAGGEGPPRPRESRLDRAALGPGTVMGLGFVGAVAFSAFLPLYARDIGIGGSQWVFLTYAAVILLVRTAGGRLPDLLGPLRAGSAATVLTAAGLILIASRPSVATLYPGTVVLAAGVALQYPALLTLTVNQVPEHRRSAAVATFTMFFDLAQGLGAVALGQVAAVGGVRLSYLAAAGSALVGLVVLRTWVRRTVGAAPAAGAGRVQPQQPPPQQAPPPEDGAAAIAGAAAPRLTATAENTREVSS